jgi:hypothetical protein
MVAKDSQIATLKGVSTHKITLSTTHSQRELGPCHLRLSEPRQLLLTCQFTGRLPLSLLTRGKPAVLVSVLVLRLTTRARLGGFALHFSAITPPPGQASVAPYLR